MRNEGERVAGPQVRIKCQVPSHAPVIIIGLNLFPDRSRDCIPSGSRSCVTSPAAGKSEQRKKQNVRNKGRSADWPQTYLINSGIFLTSLIPNSAVPVRTLHHPKLTDCMPPGSTTLSTSPAEGKVQVQREGIE